jgi:hypothetical protein
MPALPAVVNTIKATVHGRLNTTAYDNVFHLQYAGTAPSAANMATLATDVINLYNTSFISLLSVSSAETTGCDVVDLTSATSASGTASVTTVGTRVGAPLTNQAATVISWHINLRYRGGHPRTYLPSGVQTDLVDGSHYNITYINAVQSAATSFRLGINSIAVGGTTFVLAIVSYTSGGLPRPTPFVFPVQGNAVHSRVDTQRRRLGKESF